MWRRSRTAAAALALCLGAAAPMGPAFAQGSGGGKASAKIIDFGFEPGTLTVDLNTTVTWSNTGARPHTVTDRGGTFDTNPIQPGAAGEVSFTVPGTYHYFCRINPGTMNAVIVVKPGAQPSKTTRVEGLDPGVKGETLRYEPSTPLTVEAGSSVLFANVGGKAHSFTADDGSFDSGIVAPGPEGGRFAGTNATVTLNKPGTFPFHCEIHPQAMKGTVTVTGQEKAGAAPPSAAPATATVDMIDLAFKPPEASIAPGGKVTWKNTGQARHTATFDDVQPALDTNVLAPGAEATLTAPSKPGSYSYRCNIHPAKMRGVLVVVGQNTNDPVKKVSAAPAAAVGSSGPSGGIKWLVLITLAIAAFLGGLGIGAFLRRSPAR